MNNKSATGRLLLSAGLALATGLICQTAGAFEFGKDSGWRGSWDTTLSYGQASRIQKRDCNLIAVANGGCGRSPNIDDGNLNYDIGVYSNAFKAVTEISLSRDNLGFFVRGSGLYDYQVEKKNTHRTALSDDARDLVGSYTRLLDAFGYIRFDLGSVPTEFRLGRQVISWGESTFIQNGINVINHVDVSALRVPGAELKEGFLPQEIASLSMNFTENFSAEAFYQLDWDDVEPEPVGSYFSTNDFVPDGGSQVFLGFGGFSDQGVDFTPLGGPLIRNFQAVPRGLTQKPSDNGQYGLALRRYFPGVNNGTEFGFFYMRYHSRLPLISGRTGTQAGIGNAAGAATAVSGAAQALAAGQAFGTAVGNAAAQAVSRAATAGGNMNLTTATQYATIGANYALGGLSVADISRNTNNIATHEYAQTAQYFTQFPEDIKLLGLSFNTQFQSGVALQGEFTYRRDVPLQYDDVELLFAALSPLEQALFGVANPGVPFPTSCTTAGATVSRCGQLGPYSVNQVVQGWGLYDTWQFQATATTAFANILRASQMVLVAEVAVSHVMDMPEKTGGGPNGQGLRFNGPGTSVSGNAPLVGRHCPHLPTAECLALNLLEPQERFADETSWGYRVAGRLEYPNLVKSWNVLPRVSWQHDVFGTTPGPGGNFVDGRKAVTLGVSGNLRNTWELDFSWTSFTGAGRFNDINDRDFISGAIKYSF